MDNTRNSHTWQPLNLETYARHTHPTQCLTTHQWIKSVLLVWENVASLLTRQQINDRTTWRRHPAFFNNRAVALLDYSSHYDLFYITQLVTNATHSFSIRTTCRNNTLRGILLTNCLDEMVKPRFDVLYLLRGASFTTNYIIISV